MKQIVTVLALIFSLAAQAQTNTKIQGQVNAQQLKTPEAATIALLAAKDSSTIKFAVADKTGRFSFDDLKAGSYLVSVSMIGFNRSFSELVTITGNEGIVELKPVVLSAANKAMDAVVVSARKPLVEQKIDRTIVNVDASPSNVGATAMEVLEKSPGISVDKDGNISLKGKQGVMVLIDGRPTQLGAADLANLLRGMNANSLDQVEIMTNPPAKYDAAGNAGIINIKTKKTKTVGYNGSVNASYGQGFLPKVSDGFTFNYRKNKVNLFTNFSHGWRQRSQDLMINRNFLDKNSKQLLSTFDQHASMKNESRSLNGKLGMDYFASNRTTIGFVLSGFSGPGKFSNDNKTNMFDAAGNFQSRTTALSQSEERFRNYSTNLNFRHQLDSSGKEITADLDYSRYDIFSSQSLSNYYFDASGNSLQKGDTLYGALPQDIDIYSGRVDYTMPMKKGARFEAGLKTSYVQTESRADYDTLHYGVRMKDLARTNGFNYTENINAAYVNLSTPLAKKLSAQLGLRLENTIAKGYSNGYSYETATGTFIAADTSFTRSYTQLFPTAFLQYKLNDKHNLGFNYGRRIRRPNYESLNPFIEFLDRYTFQQGNPNLKPQFSHNFELSHSFKGFLNTVLNYTSTTDILQQVMEQNEVTKETFVKQDNIAKQQQFGIALSANMPVTKWWTNSIFVNLASNRFQGLINGTEVDQRAVTLMLNGAQQFKLGKTTSAEVSGWFRTGGVEGVFITRPAGGLNLGLSKTVLKGKGSIRLNVRDVLYTQVFNAKAQFGTVDARIRERGDSRVATVGFTYRFSKGKVGNVKRRSSSASDEQSRVGGGN